MARFCSLFSGSSGNCSFIGSAGAGVLIDAGVSAKRLETALMQREIDPGCVRAVFVTHEHMDHMTGLRVFTKRYGCRVYGTAGTLAALAAAGAVDTATPLCVMDGAAQEAGMEIVTVPTSHDSRESCGYRIHTADDRTVAVATDTGVFSDALRQAVSGCDLILLESNHDVAMLRSGPYPYYLKQRILSAQGHLSNDACAAELAALVKTGTTRLVLGHLSRENNRPALALDTAQAALDAAGLRSGIEYRLQVAAPVSQERVTVF